MPIKKQVKGMAKRTNHKAAIIGAAVQLFRSQGFAATGLNEILSVANAPKGSLYHYFPGGKEDIAVAAVRTGGGEVTRALERLYEQGFSGAQIVETMAAFLSKGLADSDYREGCPVATVLLEAAPGLERVAAAGRGAFDSWRGVIRAALERDGYSGARAEQLAVLAVATMEGGLIVARVESSPQSLMSAINAIVPLLKEHEPS